MVLVTEVHVLPPALLISHNYAHILDSVKRRRNWHRHDYSEINDGKKVIDLKCMIIQLHVIFMYMYTYHVHAVHTLYIALHNFIFVHSYYRQCSLVQWCL